MRNEETLKSEVIKLRCTKSECNQIKRNAEKNGLSVSDYVRSRVTKDYRTLHRKKDGYVAECLIRQEYALNRMERILSTNNNDHIKEELKAIYENLKKEGTNIWQCYM